MYAKLVVTAGPDQGRSFPLKVGETIQVGRSPAATARLSDPAVSRVHCEIEVGEGQTTLHNISDNGTVLQGKKVDQAPVKSGDVIRVGNSELQYVVAAVGVAMSSDLDRLVGQKLDDYQIESILARGTNGVVFKAKETTTDRVVALKVLAAEFAENEEDVDRFIRAMRTMVPTRHPHIVAIHGAGKTGPFCWTAMELVEGDSLATLIKRGPMDWKEVYRVAVHIGRALEQANEMTIVHRNVAPPNILYRSKDRIAKLGDLILAKALEGRLAQQVTRAGQVLGEVAYMAPERLEGKAADIRSDLYGLGASLYAALTGQPPFGGTKLHEITNQIRTTDPEPIQKRNPSVPPEFAALVMKLLPKNPADRYQKPNRLVVDLEDLGDKLRVSAVF